MSVNRIPSFLKKTDEFTSSGSWTCPGGVYSVDVFAVGGGGGGGGLASTATKYSAGGGGGGGAVKQLTLPVTPGVTYTVTVGAGGTGGTDVGGTGGTTSFGSLLSALGGGGGGGVNSGGSLIAATGAATGGGSGVSSGAAPSAMRGGGGGGGALPDTKLDENKGLITPKASIARRNGTLGSGNYSDSLNQASGYGQIGINGYGSGGSGGHVLVSGSQSNFAGENAGEGATRSTAGATNGENAVANFGGGGGGSVAFNSTATATGGNGGSGVVRITYQL